ncbi:MGDG synthase family glycosyltransferase [Paenibacillus senegalensis]|uniref:MGDG synthase family glycosyltransferase n=1 Tax=Paenibacillus senegalensis TaxID=1465766 RepID=UPI00028827B0|nr:glycosyltransferase [Paenibacillus senegalensis]
MRPDTKILILTAGYGEGHNQVSYALQQSFTKIGLNQVAIIDLFQAAYPVMNEVTKLLYRYSLASSNIGINYYGWSYNLTNRMPVNSIIAKWINSLGGGMLMKIIKNANPDVLIYTFPFGNVRDRIEKLGIKLTTAAIITDFTVHRRWLYARPDHYFVATEDVKQTLISQDVADSRITVTGIPIRESFQSQQGSGKREKSILVMAAACGGASSLKSLIRELLLIPEVRIDVVCGRDSRLERKMSDEWGNEARVRIYGFTDRMASLMREAACIVTKAGGVTLSEAIYAGVPIFILRPFPGQEKENARYLESKGMAFVADTVQDLAARMRLLFALRQREAGNDASAAQSQAGGRIG